MANRSHQREAALLSILCILFGGLGIPGLLITHVTPQRSDAFFTPKGVITVFSLLSLFAFLWIAIQLSRQVESSSRKIRMLIMLTSAALVGSYVVLIFFLVFFQDQFIIRNSIIFQPRAMTQETANSFVQGHVERLDFVARDQTRLSGWLVRSNPEDRSPLIIYFGGSSQEVSSMIPYFQQVDGWTTALVNYRGYGLSEGDPSEEDLFQDALLIYDTLSKREDIAPERIVAMGWSLGTGTAVYLSEQRVVRGTILITPFDSWAHMFQSRDFPWIPLSLIHDEYFIFNSIQRVPSIQNPLLCLVDVKDKIVLPRLSQNLVDKWSGEATMIMYEHANHGLLFQENSSWQDISVFLESLE